MKRRINHMAVLQKKLRGSFTVEATVIVGLTCIITGMMMMLAMYCHDRVVMCQTADKAAADGAMWCGNYVSPNIKEVDYEQLKRMAGVEISDSTVSAQAYLEKALLMGKTESISVTKTKLGQQVTAVVTVHFSFAGRDIIVTEEGEAAIFGSLRFKRRSLKQGEGNQDDGG